MSIFLKSRRLATRLACLISLILMSGVALWLRTGDSADAWIGPLERARPQAVNSEPPERKDTPAPNWTIGYGHEFWRVPSPMDSNLTTAPNVNVQEVVDRVSHAFRSDGVRSPAVVARDYEATMHDAALQFKPGSPDESSEPNFTFSTASVRLGEHEIYSTHQSGPKTWIAGNTVQSFLQPAAGLVQHVQARAEGVEIAWVLHRRPQNSGSLRIEAELNGLSFAGATKSGFHFADQTETPRVRVGFATLVDSSGNRAPLPTEIIASRLVVQVPEDLLATAAYPIAIDPLISPEFGIDRPVSAITSGENPKVASNGADYLVVWHDWRSNRDSDIYCARVSRDGWILDPNGIGVRVGHAGQDKFAVASNGADYFVVWTEYGSSILGARISSSGAVLDLNALIVCQSPLFPTQLSVAGNGDDYLVLWRDNRDHRYDLYGGAVRASDGHVSDIRGTKLVEEPGVDSPAAVTPHLGGFAAVWRGTAKTEGAFYRIQDGVIIPIAGIQIPSAAGPITEPAIASGPAGILIAWEDFTNAEAGGTDIYGQIFAPTGQSISAKFPICTAPHNQTAPALGANSTGFIVAWQDNRRGAGLESTNDIYFARVSRNGAVTPSDGEILIAEPADNAYRDNQVRPVIASNGEQSLVVWLQKTLDFNQSVRSVRIASDGTILDPRGMPITVATINSQQTPAVAANSAGFLVAWVDQRDGSDIYAARLTREGRVLDPAGILVSAARSGQSQVSLASNGSDYFAVWSDSRNQAQEFSTDIYGARITATGAVIDSAGIPINSSPGYDSYPRAASDGTNYVAVWQHLDLRDFDVQARVIRSVGDPLAFPAVQIKGPGPAQLYPSVASNGREYVIAWTDGDENYADAYGQRLDQTGVLVGVAYPISALPRRQVAPLIASNGVGYFVTWLDGNYDASNFDPQTMLGARLNAAGEVLDNPPILVQPATHYFLRRAITSDGRDYLVLWQIADGPIRAVRINPDGERLDAPEITVAGNSTGLSHPAAAAVGGTYLVAYASSDTPGNFWRIRAKTVQFTLPHPWHDADIGSTATPGSGFYNEGLFTINGSGERLSGDNETFFFVYQTLQGDGQIIARVKSFTTLQPSGRAGLMIRESAQPGARHAFIGVNGSNETVFARRRNFGGDTRTHTGGDSSPPIWLKLIRAGELILAYHSHDGVAWQRFDSTTIDFGESLLIGFAINSGDDDIATAQIDRVSIWRFQEPIQNIQASAIRIQQPISPSLTADFVTLHLTGETGGILQLETSSNLIDWTLLQNITNATGTITITDPRSTDQNNRFYRVAD
jgi:hypothetical protein